MLGMRQEKAPYLGPLAETEGERRAEYAKRSKVYNEETFPYALQPEKEQAGWIVVRENKDSVRMRIPKSADEILENRFWNVLYRFGYDELNIGRQFKVSISKKDEGLTKQIDVFGKDLETVVVAECKTALEPGKKNLQFALGEFANLQKPIANSLRKHYDGEFNQKIIWFFVTDKIRWRESDLIRASDSNIHVVQARELLYLEEIAKKLSTAARYQFHAEFLAKQKVPALRNRALPAVKTKLGGHVAYFFSARPLDIFRIAFVNHRDLRDPSGTPSYQRLVNPNRLKEIGQFLDNGGYFPNTILLNFRRKPHFNRSSKDPLAKIQFGELILPDRYKSCWVVDGQHRLYGTTFSKKMDQDAPLFFVAYEGVSSTEEANTFITINEKQTKVPKKLLTELDGELKWDSDNPKEKLSAIASRAVDLLNNKGGSPFENKFVTPGVSVTVDQPLTLPNFQQAIMQSRLVGSVNARTEELLPGPCWEKDSEGSLVRLVELLSWYFGKLETLAPERWSQGKSGYLCSNFGVYGHVRLIGELLQFAAQQENFNPVEKELDKLQTTLTVYLKPIWNFISDSGDENFAQRFKVPPGSGGQARYFFKLAELIRKNHSDFEPDGFEKYIQTVSEGAVQQADRNVRWIQKVVPEFVIEKLREEFGEQFFEQCVPKEIQKTCQSKRIDDDLTDQLSVEHYLDWLQVRKIIEQRELRDKFNDTLSIQMPDEKKGRHAYFAWFDRINEIRRISAHPAGRQYKEEDVDFLRFVVGVLEKRLPEDYAEGQQ